jgi:hypothetical protein
LARVKVNKPREWRTALSVFAGLFRLSRAATLCERHFRDGKLRKLANLYFQEMRERSA